MTTKKKQTAAKAEAPPKRGKGRPRDEAKEDLFVEHKSRGETNGEAATAAGYGNTHASAKTHGQRLMTREDIRARVEARRAQALESARLDTDEIIGTLVEQMRGDFADLLPEDVFLQEAHARGVSHLIKELEITERVFPGDEDGPGFTERKYKIKMHDSQSAAKHLSAIFELVKQPKPNGAAGEGPTPASDLTPRQKAARAADLLEQGRQSLSQLA